MQNQDCYQGCDKRAYKLPSEEMVTDVVDKYPADRLWQFEKIMPDFVIEAVYPRQVFTSFRCKGGLSLVYESYT